MNCRVGCGACCTVISISSRIPGMPNGKPAGVRCINLDAKNQCKIWNREDYPRVCAEFSATIDLCGKNKEDAQVLLKKLEEQTAPG